MTNEEAIVIIKGHKAFAIGKYDWQYAFDLAVEALEKQTAKTLVNKPVMSNTLPEWAIRDRFYCPCCGEYVGNCNLDEELLSEGESHCPHCGQNLKEWSE